MKRAVLACLLTLGLPVIAAAEPAPELGTQFELATAMVVNSEMNTYVETRERAISDKQVVIVGECHRFGEHINTWSFPIVYKQTFETYQVEVSKGRGILNFAHTEKEIDGSQREVVHQWQEEWEADDADFDSNTGDNCGKAQRLQLRLIAPK